MYNDEYNEKYIVPHRKNSSKMYATIRRNRQRQNRCLYSSISWLGTGASINEYIE